MQNICNNHIKKALLTVILIIFTHITHAQEVDSVKSVYHFGGGIDLTNNGISLLPTFSLGKPAVTFDMSVGNKKLSFEPQFRFSLEGEPWAFLFWWRYKLVTAEKFRLNVGAHPAISFRRDSTIINGVSEEVLVSKRYLATEVSPSYMLSKNISLGMYYLYSHGFDPGVTKNVHFLTVNSRFSNIKLIDQFYLDIFPQVYYLRMDDDDGFYLTAKLSLSRKNFPLSISSILNKVIQTDITASKDFVWNISLIYRFNREYVKRQ